MSQISLEMIVNDLDELLHCLPLLLISIYLSALIFRIK